VETKYPQSDMVKVNHDFGSKVKPRNCQCKSFDPD